MGKGGYLTLQEAALRCDKTSSWVMSKICAGKLDAKLEGHAWLVSAESLRKFTSAFSSAEAETPSQESLTPRLSRKVSAEQKPKPQQGSAAVTRARKPNKKSNAPTSDRKGSEAEPEPNRRESVESRIKALDRKIARFGDQLRKEMIQYGPAGDVRGPEPYGKAAEKLLRVWRSARQERAKLVVILENLDESGRVIVSSPLPNAPDEKTNKRPIGGIDGYHDGKIRTTEGRSPAGEATSTPRLMILRARALESARKMLDRGTSRDARDAAKEQWAQTRAEAQRLGWGPIGAPMPVKRFKAKRTVAKDKPDASKARKSPAPSRRTTSSPSSSAPSKSVARAPGKDKRSGPTRGTASPSRTKAHEISRISRLMEEKGYPAPLGDPASGIVLVVEQPVGPRVLEALKACLGAVKLPEAYVTYASTGFLKEELIAIEPHALIAVGLEGARDIDITRYVRRSFFAAEPGVWFPGTKGVRGLLLPSLVPALDDRAAKHRFWRAFLGLKALAPAG